MEVDAIVDSNDAVKDMGAFLGLLHEEGIAAIRGDDRGC